MSVTQVSKLEVTTLFEDATTAKIVLDRINPATMTSEQIEKIRESCMAFNRANGGELASKMKSKNGTDWIGIKQVKLTTTNKDILW